MNNAGAARPNSESAQHRARPEKGERKELDSGQPAWEFGGV